MKLSTKGRYALSMMIDLAEHPEDGYISLKDIAERQHISKKYLEQIIPIFNKTDMLLTTRGAQGGYKLARNPEKYTVGEILRLTEGTLSPVACAEDPVVCDRSAVCATISIWKGLSRVINEYLDGITLQDVVEQQQERYENSYEI